MPTAPKVQDPFNNYVKNKDESRMPSGPRLPPELRPSPTEFMIAAANMHEMGRLFAPDSQMLETVNPLKAPK